MIAPLLQGDLSGWLIHFGTVLVRIVGLFVFLPVFGSQLIPIRFRLATAMVLAVALMPFAPPLEASAYRPLELTVVAVRELTIGFALGVTARMVFAGVEGAAGLVAGQSGFALASMIDPTSGDQALAPALFQNLLHTAVFLAADLHHLFIRALVGSYELMPPSASLPATDGLDKIASMLGLRVFGVAVELAAPALIVTVTIDLVMGLVGRAMPQVPILLVGYPFKMAAGLVAMAILATTTGAAIGWIGRTVAADGARLLTAFSGG